jgi:hypothetical protein
MPIAALLLKIVADKPRNAVWQDFGRNPKGRALFFAIRRCSALM